MRDRLRLSLAEGGGLPITGTDPVKCRAFMFSMGTRSCKMTNEGAAPKDAQEIDGVVVFGEMRRGGMV